MAHDAAEWGAWGQGFPRNEAQYVAFDVSKNPAPVIVLPPGGAQLPLPGDLDRSPVHHRTRRGDFHCLVPGCGPFESSVAYEKRRHCFRHHSAPPEGRLPGHDPESMHHRNAKHELANWLQRELGPHLLGLYRDEHRVTTQNGEFEPDIYAELDTGARIAVEYQHSPGDPTTVLRKQLGYTAEDITCWWIFGPYQKTFVLDPSQVEGREPHILLTTVQGDLARERVQFHWFNVERRVVGTPFNQGRLRIFERPGELWHQPNPSTQQRYIQHPWPHPEFVVMDPHPLDSCSVDIASGQLVTPTNQAIRRAKAASDREVAHMRHEARRRLRETELTDQETPLPVAVHSADDFAPPVDVPPAAAEERAPLPPTQVPVAQPATRKPWWKRVLGL